MKIYINIYIPSDSICLREHYAK